MRSSFGNHAGTRSLTLVLAMLLLLVGCAATKVGEVWKDDSFQGHPKNVLIIAFAKNATVRREIESGIAKRLKARGANATESFRVIPEGIPLAEDSGRLAVHEVIKERGIDAVLLGRVTGRRYNEQFIPGMTITASHGYPGGAYGAWGGYSAVVYSSGPTAPTTQGYSHETKFFDIETHLFDMKDDKLVWAMRTETRLSGAPQEEIKPFIELVTQQLFQSNIF